MSEVKVMVFNGDLAKFVKEPDNVVYKNCFLLEKGYVVQKFSYNCEMNRDTVNTVYSQTGNVVVDFTIRVMNNDQSLFYGKHPLHCSLSSATETLRILPYRHHRDL